MKPKTISEETDIVTLEVTVNRSLFDRLGETGIAANIIAAAVISEHFERVDGSPGRSWPSVPTEQSGAFREKVKPVLGKRFGKLPEVAKELLLSDLEDGDPAQALEDFEIPNKTQKAVLAIVRAFRMEGGPTSEH